MRTVYGWETEPANPPEPRREILHSCRFGAKNLSASSFASLHFGRAPLVITAPLPALKAVAGMQPPPTDSCAGPAAAQRLKEAAPCLKLLWQIVRSCPGSTLGPAVPGRCSHANTHLGLVGAVCVCWVGEGGRDGWQGHRSLGGCGLKARCEGALAQVNKSAGMSERSLHACTCTCVAFDTSTHMQADRGQPSAATPPPREASRQLPAGGGHIFSTLVANHAQEVVPAAQQQRQQSVTATADAFHSNINACMHCTPSPMSTPTQNPHTLYHKLRVSTPLFFVVVCLKVGWHHTINHTHDALQHTHTHNTSSSSSSSSDTDTPAAAVTQKPFC